MMAGYTSGFRRDRDSLLSDLEIVKGDVETVYQRLIPQVPAKQLEPATTAASSSAADPSPDVARERRRLEEAHSARLLELSSARRTRRTYQRGAWGFLAGILVSLGLACAGVATALITSAIDVDGSVPVLILLLSGVPLLAASATGMYLWQVKFRIKVKRIERGYGTISYEGVDYLDPQLNVELAEVEYAKALARLTEHKGTKSD